MYWCVAMAVMFAAPGAARAEIGPTPVVPFFTRISLESDRLERAKDLIADEQWVRAMQELKAAADDPKEGNKDEALFWLAHSQNQARESLGALETIERLERGYPKSRWVKPARSLGLEIAQRLGRRDVLWFTAAPPPPPPAPPAAVPPAPPTPAAPVPPPPPGGTRHVTPRMRPAAPLPPPPPASAPHPPAPPRIWTTDPDTVVVDTDLRIQALGSLIKTDATRVIPMLKEIALASENAGEVRRALFILAQSGRPEARSTVVEVARSGSEPVRIAAVRELGRLPGPGISNELLSVYSSANGPVKYQVVSALGQRSATVALMRIAESETDARLRNFSIVTLGQAGGREQLNLLYARSAAETKRSIITGLFNAHADEELIRIADRERDDTIRREALASLRLLNTARAKAYLEKMRQK